MTKLRAFTMPKWGIEMTEGTVAEWMVAEGAAFTKGDILTLIETDKITNEVEAEFAATLARIVAPAGSLLPVGALLGVFSDGPADAAAVDEFIASFGAAQPAASAPPPVAQTPVAQTAVATPERSTAKLRAFTMPKWGIEMTEGTIAEWMVAEGAAFTKGDVLTLIETDKITNEVEAEFAATLARIVAPAGSLLPVGALLGVFSEGPADAAVIDEFIASFGGAQPAASAPAPVAQAPVASAPAAPAPIPDDLAISPAARREAGQLGVEVTTLAGSGRGGRVTHQDVVQASRPAVSTARDAPVSIAPTSTGLDGFFASPLAKRLSLQHGVDLATVSGTGPRGRIGKADVLACIPKPAVAPPPPQAATAPPVTAEVGVEVVRMSPMRKAIARQLSLSKATIPHFYLRNSARIDALLALRKQAKAATGEAPSINDYLIRACALALRAHPDINVQVHGDEIHRYPHADVAVAVATEKGLITPILRAAEGKSVAKISAEVKSLADRARAGKLQAAEFQGGSFSVSNLGMFGIETFDAIINPPQGAILAVGAARQETFGIDNALTFATRIKLSLSCDHRAIDGAVGARFLADLTRLIEAPEELTR